MTHSFHSRNFERPFCGPESRSTRSRSSEADPLRTQFRPTRARLPRRGEQRGRKKCCCRPTRCHLFAASEACDVVHSPHSRASRGFEVEWSEWADASVRVAALIQASARRVASERTPGRAPLAPLAARRCCRCEQRCNGDGSSSFHAAAVAGHCCKQQE